MGDARDSSGEGSSGSNSTHNQSEIVLIPKNPDDSQGWHLLIAPSTNKSGLSGFVVFRDQAGRRDSVDRAGLWVALQKRLQLDEPLEFQEEMTNECSRACVPAVVAGEGKPATAAMLAAHGFSNSEIADALGVGARTISQYLSDFRKGER